LVGLGLAQEANEKAVNEVSYGEADKILGGI
jgi:hypothetical protein